MTNRTRSDLELLFLAVCEEYSLPRPEVNVRVAGRLVDFFFRDAGLVVETDSWSYHRGSAAFEDDHGRDLALHALGFTVRRYTGRQLEGAPGAVVADLRQALGPAS